MVEKKFVVVADVKVAFAPVTFWRDVEPSTVNVEVTVELEPTKPPKRTRVLVAVAPRAETVASVSTSESDDGQLSPFCRQVAEPFTKSALALSVEPEAFVKKRLVAVAFVNVAFAPVRFCSDVEPRTVNVLVTVELAPTYPPYKLSVDVASAPRAVTVASVSISVSDEGQLVPSARQTSRPFTKSWDVEAVPEINKFVDVVFVPVALDQFRFVVLPSVRHWLAV